MPRRCGICDKELSNSGTLTRHIKVVHDGEKSVYSIALVYKSDTYCLALGRIAALFQTVATLQTKRVVLIVTFASSESKPLL